MANSQFSNERVPQNKNLFSPNPQIDNLEEEEDFDSNWSFSSHETEDSVNYESKIIKLFYQYKNVYTKEDLLAFHHPTTCTDENLQSMKDIFSEQFLVPINSDPKSLSFFEDVFLFCSSPFQL